MRRDDDGRRGQTTLEWVGVIFVAAVMVLIIAGSAGDVGRTLTCAVGAQIQKLTGGEPDASCADGSRAAADADPATPEPFAPDPVAPAGDPSDLPSSTLVGDLEGVGGYPPSAGGRGGTQARAAFIKKLVCKIPGIKQICKWTLGRLEDELVKACTKSVKACNGLIDKACKIGGKVCDIARELSCLVLDVLCKKTKAKPRPKLVAPFNRQRDRVIKELDKRSRPSGSKRARGRRITTRSPHDEAYRYFNQLTRGPGVKRVKKTENLWEVRTPDGRHIRLRNPSASSEGKWTIDVRPPGGTPRNEIHYKFVEP